MNKKNLLKLAEYLDTLPLDYEDFEMSDFLVNGDREKYSVYALKNGGVATTCGAVACAIGHGPSAGFLFQQDELAHKELWNIDKNAYDRILTPLWHNYSTRVFCNSEGDFAYEWQFMFGSAWSGADNTPIGAAARIRMVVNELGDHDFDSLYYATDPETYEHHIKPESLDYWKDEVS